MPASWRTSDLTVLAVAAAGTVVLTTASFVVTPPALPRNDGSSYATHPDGARAAYLLLQALGYDVERSFEPLAVLRRPAESTVLVIAHPSEPPSEQDVRALRRFVERGGFVLVTGPLAASFLPGAPLTLTPRGPRARTHQASLPSPLSAGVPDVEMPSAGSSLPLDSPFVPVYGSYADVAVATATLGSGRAVWWAGSDPLLNGAIGRPGHAELFMNAIGSAGDRTVLWDEFYHGHARSLWSYLAATPLPIAMLQLLAVVAAGLFTFTRRRRPIRALAAQPRTSPLEFIDTMASLYERARAASAAVSTVRERVRRRLLDTAGLPAATTDEGLFIAAGERLSLGAEASTVMARAREASIDPDLSSQQALEIVADLQRLGAQVRAMQGQRQRKT
jgi:Domain of unknown function (DUF4350)